MLHKHLLAQNIMFEGFWVQLSSGSPFLLTNKNHNLFISSIIIIIILIIMINSFLFDSDEISLHTINTVTAIV